MFIPIQWPKEKGPNNDLQNTTRTPLKMGREVMCCGRVSSSYSTRGTRRVTLVTIPVINHEWGKRRIVMTTHGTHS